ncbi:MAG: TetR/AcrR family transcriptional regulator [Gordonia sp. (in: high G+C Gram-positive bacteria)]
MATAPITKRTPATEVRANLLRAGREILERDGVAGLTVRAVAKAAGVAPMGVYNHFDGKGGLLDALVSDAFDEFAVAIAATDTDPVDRLTASGRAYRRFALANPVAYSLMFSTACQPDADTAARAFAVLVGIIQYGQAGGVLHAGDPTAMAIQAWSAVHGAVSLELSAKALEMGGDPDEIYEGILRFVARGLRRT